MRSDASAALAWDPALAPEALLRAVREAGGGVAALAALRRGLRSGELHLVTQQCAPLGDMGRWGEKAFCGRRRGHASRVAARPALGRAAPGRAVGIPSCAQMDW